MIVTTDTWLAFLESHVGDTEHPPGSNCCIICDEYNQTHNLGVKCYAWCCATQDLATKAAFGDFLLQTAAVGQAMNNAKQGLRGLLWIPRSAVVAGEDLRVGDLCCWDYGRHGNWNDMHIDAVVNPYTNSRFQTIDGNRQNRCDYFWNTLNDQTMGFIRLPFDNHGLGSNPPPAEEDDMWSEAEKDKLWKTLDAHGAAIADIQNGTVGESGILPIVKQVRGALQPEDKLDKPLAPSTIDNQLKQIRRSERKVASAVGVTDATKPVDGNMLEAKV